MREIKFRLWDKEEKYMTSFEEIRILPNDYNLCQLFEEDGRYHWMQYTGLKDKNGKEIYEGDICKIKYIENIGYEDVIGEVKWYQHHTHYSLNGNDGTPYSLNMGGSLVDGIYVIGNIHENPELIEK